MACKQIEVFTSGCQSCIETMKLIARSAPSDCQIIEYNIKTQSGACLEKAISYGIKSTPTIVVDGKIVCVGKPTAEQLAAAGIG